MSLKSTERLGVLASIYYDTHCLFFKSDFLKCFQFPLLSNWPWRWHIQRCGFFYEIISLENTTKGGIESLSVQIFAHTLENWEVVKK